MSYLGALRLIFAGRFQANVSTVNNDPAHFDNAAFQPSYQKMQGPNMNPPNGWFNPEGDAAFRLLGCRVTSAWTPAGRAAADDPALSCIVADSDDRAPAKLVDLDSEQQLVSEIWGLQVRIADSSGSTLLRGDYEPAAFLDIWDRATGGSAGDVGAGATYQSVLRNLQWGDVSKSTALTKLRESASGGRLSIKFNVDGMNLDFTSPDFMTGRIVGAIGPTDDGEPAHLVLGRQFMASAGSGGNFFTPAGAINFFPAVLDEPAGALYLDLGNALSTVTPGGAMNDLGDLNVFVSGPDGAPLSLGTIASQGAEGYSAQAGWYERTAGIVALPLTSDQVTAAKSTALHVSGNAGVSIDESPSGAFVRADTYVYRMSPGDEVSIRIYATKFGKPLAGTAIESSFDSAQLQAQVDPTQDPPVASPAETLAFDSQATTDANGVAVLKVKAGDPGTPRWFNDGADYGIDGQVYGVRPAFADPTLAGGPVNQWNFISFLVWSGFAPAKPITWTEIHPILQQYANLYPVMNRFLNMGDEASVKANKGLMKLAFGLDPADPNAMPVTRDLSPAKRSAILEWLDNPLTGPVRQPAARAATTAAAAPPSAVARGGKAAAAARRLVMQSREIVK
jgi:hypothetical protein